ncbi:unnamed protein product [Psylliodes chrysocephalus]|uniref:Voltage-dependent calcium channel alpha-2/delta subunit conserved region domain-containing protein n=1 Tax=Psylliodes chrysocephalus TaxID=3402493 RepID=A0A9P0CQ86_9CUCU|nr:unnamed protein product [Psylliodes chrysocephala]
MGYRKLKHMLSAGHLDRTFVHQQKLHQDNYGDTQVYHLMTSVSLPVYDKKPRQERVANLLGVAGTDIPIEYIQRLMLPYRLGVNGYAFIVTNNGYILTHPDLRPVYQGILKPAYNRVDMIEIEILDDDSDPRNFSDIVRDFRKHVVMQGSGNITLKVKGHLDDMRRITFNTKHYYYRGINGTPFSLVIALPDKYGYYRIEPKVENDIHRLTLSQDKKPLLRYFTGNWTIHPDWHYCRYADNRKHFEDPEEELLYFLQMMEKYAWKWSKESECDRKLVVQLVSDAKLTDWFNDNITTTSREENGNGGHNGYEFKEILDFFELCRCCKCSCNNSFSCRAELVKKIGIVVAFMATHSGLTRWQNFPQNIETPETEPNFNVLHNKAIDEVWYRRAVDHHYVDPGDFIYAVPHYIGNSSHSLVTVSRAVFKEEEKKKEKAPVAVVGYQFFHGALQNLFTQITSNCGNIPCTRTCASQELHCLVLDDNGYVVVSDDPKETGFFFGKIMPDVMNQLLDERIYKATVMYDYQGLCAEGQESESPASRLLSPLVHLTNLFHWFTGYLIILTQTVFGTQFESFPAEQYEEHFEVMDEHEYASHNHEHDHYEESEMPLSDKEFVQKFAIEKTKPEPCDTQMALYSLIHYSDRDMSASAYNKTMVECSRPYIVQKISGSNMVLLVVNSVCLGEPNTIIQTPDPEEVDYNMSLACYRAAYNDFPRRQYMSCINRNANESEIKICGKASYISPTKIVPMLLLAILSFILLS